MTLTLTDCVTPSPDTLFKNLDGEAVLVSLANSTYYGLDEVGTRIWELIAENLCLADVLAKVLAEYEVAEEAAKTDLLRLVQELLETGLVEHANR